MKKVQVEIIKAKGHELNSERSLFVAIDPAFAHMAGFIKDELEVLLGHDRVSVMPVPSGAVEFYQIEHPYIIGVEKPEAKIEN